MVMATVTATAMVTATVTRLKTCQYQTSYFVSAPFRTPKSSRAATTVIPTSFQEWMTASAPWTTPLQCSRMKNPLASQTYGARPT